MKVLQWWEMRSTRTLNICHTQRRKSVVSYTGAIQGNPFRTFHLSTQLQRSHAATMTSFYCSLPYGVALSCDRGKLSLQVKLGWTVQGCDIWIVTCDYVFTTWGSHRMFCLSRITSQGGVENPLQHSFKGEEPVPQSRSENAGGSG